ncbi:hypothetical protein [Emticicia fontis]
MKHLLNCLGRFIAGILLLIFFFYSLTSCKTIQVIREIRTDIRAVKTQISRLDSTYRYNQTIIIQYEKDKAQAKFGTMPTDSLLQYIRSNP